MTLAASTTDGSAIRAGYPLVLLAARTPHPDGCPPWPDAARCDLVAAPLDACCGVIAHLARADIAVCPVAQLGDWMVFLTAEGSAVHAAPRDGLPPDLIVHSGVDDFPAEIGAGDVGGCWVIPPECAGSELPPAGAVLSALRSAYAEYEPARKMKIVQ